MRIGIIGISHQTAEISLREKIAKACHRRLGAGCVESLTFSCVLLTTCNRTEIYFSADDLSAAHCDILQILREEVSQDFEHCLYTFFGLDCFSHLIKVTSGLESVILGESEIQKQVKTTYVRAAASRPLQRELHYLFQKTLKVAKEVRCDPIFPRSRISLEGTLLYLIQNMRKNWKDLSVLFIGNSEINRKILSYFTQKGVERIFLSTRSHANLPEKIQIGDWNLISSWKKMDVIISGTNCDGYLISQNEEVTQNHLIFDLSVPRSVHPELSRHPEISLFNIEQLGELVESRRAHLAEEAAWMSERMRSYAERYVYLYMQNREKVSLRII